jgi:hypothetical protein
MKFLGQLLTWRRVDTIGDARRTIARPCWRKARRGNGEASARHGDPTTINKGAGASLRPRALARRVANGFGFFNAHSRCNAPLERTR